MKKTILIISVVIVCVGILVFWGVNRFKSDPSITTSAGTTAALTTESKNLAASTTSATTESSNKAAETSENKTPDGNAEISIGTGSGAAGSTVIIPISVKNVPEKGIGSFNFNIKYDTNILEVVEVLSGEVIGSNSSNLDYSIIDSTGLVSFLFTNSNNGKDTITKPGVIANISFKVKNGAQKGTTKITNGTPGAFGDVSQHKINVVYTEGEMTVQ